MDLSSKLAIAQEVCIELGLNLWHLQSEMVQANVNGEVEAVIKYWPREAVLLNSGLHISAEENEPNTQRSIARLIVNIPGPIFLGTRERWDISLLSNVSFDVRKPTKIEQFDLWKSLLGDKFSGIEQRVQRLTNQFDLEESKIVSICQEAQLLSDNTTSSLSQALWNACLETARPKMSGLAERVISSATMQDLILPENEKQILQEIVIHVTNRNKVYEEWGFGSLTSRGLGITALFSGLSGTGKTMAAEVLANELGLDLYKIDLSTVVSKYIGETEKNIRRVFDGAEGGGTILFFDEADALFGKRTEVRDSHDRLANIEISYLLTKMESYRGLAILATNMRNALDTAFLRRIRFVVNFPFPDYKSRKEIWKSVFPVLTPVGEIDHESLAQLNISGGNIRNIALNASFLAADEGSAVNMKHLKHAAQMEYAKLEKPFAETEVGGWK
jgi:AAA+ superfamily predicted ATPase